MTFRLVCPRRVHFKRSDADFVTRSSPNRQPRWLSSFLIASALILVQPNLSVAAKEAAPRAALAQVDKALKAGDQAQARALIEKALTPKLAQSKPADAAKLAFTLVEIAGYDHDWADVYARLLPLADPLVQKLRGQSLDDFVFNLSVAAGMIKDNAAQDKWLARAVEIATREAGEQSDRALKMRANAAYSLLSVGRNQEALDGILGAMKAMELHEAGDLFFRTAGQALNEFHERMGTEAAELILQYGLQSRLIMTDKGPGKGYFWFNAGAYLRDVGAYGQSIQLNQQAMNVLFTYYGPNSKAGFNAYDGLAQSMHAAGQLAGAEAAYHYVYSEARRIFGEDDPDVWRMGNNYAAVLRSLKLPVKALEIDKVVYDKRYRKFGGGSGDAIISATNLAHDLMEADRYSDAKSVLASIGRTIGGKGYEPAYRTEIAGWQDYVAYRLGEKTLDRDRLQAIPQAFDNIELSLAFLDLFADEAEKAGLPERVLAFRLEADRKAREQFGDLYPVVFETGLDVAKAYEQRDDARAAEQYRRLTTDLFEWTRANTVASGSLNAGLSARILADDAISAYAQFTTRYSDAGAAFASLIETWKPMDRRAERDLWAEAETTDDANYRKLIDTYLSAYGRLREIVAGTLFGSNMAPLHEATQEARLQLNDARKSKGLEPITSFVQQDVKVLGPAISTDAGDAMADLFVTRTWPADRSGEPLTMDVRAVITRPGEAPRVVPILSVPMSADPGQVKLMISTLIVRTAVVFNTAAKGMKSLYVVPDEILYQLPFAELRLLDGRRLGESVDVHVMTTADAYRYRTNHAVLDGGTSALLAGGLSYGADQKKLALPASKTEVEEIAKLMRDGGYKAELLTDTAATESKLAADIGSARLIHLATHGFFHSGEDENAALFNAGFILSNPRFVAKGQETPTDNVVYAREVLNWDLRNTDLVVIAACDTALGDMGISSTLRGLPLALSVAGARRSLLTIDSIPDEATSRFMIRFYQHMLNDKLSYSDAFIRTKRDAWKGDIPDVPPDMTYAFVLFEH
ncbi:CHAT domain-containing protein [Oryzifoliimicrobium ureilyticus]|uniref:CHAT domain-containing protein n=1 Tax=Oryzifoliimicrobium ureilyticus TaxID=3113724 RepID=UPI0030767E2C